MSWLQSTFHCRGSTCLSDPTHCVLCKHQGGAWDQGEEVSSLPHRVQAGIESGDLALVDPAAASSSVSVPAAKLASLVIPVETFSVSSAQSKRFV